MHIKILFNPETNEYSLMDSEYYHGIFQTEQPEDFEKAIVVDCISTRDTLRADIFIRQHKRSLKNKEKLSSKLPSYIITPKQSKFIKRLEYASGNKFNGNTQEDATIFINENKPISKDMISDNIKDAMCDLNALEIDWDLQSERDNFIFNEAYEILTRLVNDLDK